MVAKRKSQKGLTMTSADLEAYKKAVRLAATKGAREGVRAEMEKFFKLIKEGK